MEFQQLTTQITQDGRSLLSIPPGANINNDSQQPIELKGFTAADLVSFGNYLLSPQRTEKIIQAEEETGVPYIYSVGQVHDADLSNWIESLK